MMYDLIRSTLRLAFLFLCIDLSWPSTSWALSGQAYLDRFNQFTVWYQQLPINPSPAFLDFVKDNSPLANKLRDKWLYELARTKNWEQYTTYYQPTDDINLACYYEIARYNLGQHQQVIQTAMPLWLSGESRPQACNTLFDLLLKDDNFSPHLITQRLELALDKHNTSLASYLLKQYKQPRTQAITQLNTIAQRPIFILSLEPGEFSSHFYLYGLKRLMAISMDKALQVWHAPKTQYIMSEKHQQAFLAHLALYKAMRNNQDTLYWFSKIKPEYYNDTLMDWQIRFALKNREWKRVITLINKANNKDTPIWQYWLARALEQEGQQAEAQALYESLAKSRQYYGFLASIRLKRTPNFDNEQINTHLDVLAPYQVVINQIETLYNHKQIVQASRLLNDFISELPKDEASALIYWVNTKLHWYGKAVYLSNNDTLNNQLALRFPLAYETVVRGYARQYAVAPEFAYAIIRQESSFREDAVSSAGARGLMQVMPYTARVVSKAHKIDYNHQNQLFVSQKNINIGVAYLQQLIKRFGNHPILAAAAYNAGPKQVVNWLRNQPPKEIDLWVETLPWQETRNYLKNIIAFAAVYQYRLQQQPNLKSFLEPLS